MTKRDLLVLAASLSLLLLFWELVPAFFEVEEYIFPRLSRVVKTAYSWRVRLLSHSVTTLSEAAFGFLLGGGGGLLVGIAMSESRIFQKITEPYIVAANAVPVVAIAPLVVLWLGHGFLAKAAVAAFLCFFPSVVNTYVGLTNYDHGYEELFDSWRSSKSTFLLKYKIPRSLPEMFAGLKISATFSVVGAIVAEFIGSAQGLGFAILQSSYTLNTPRLFTAIVASCLLGLSAYGSLCLCHYLSVKWLLSKRYTFSK